MERRKFLTTASLGAAAGAGLLLSGCGKEEAAPAAAPAAPAAPAVVTGQTIRWRLASSFPKALDTIYGAAETFAAKVKELSGGKFEISIHPGGELVPPFGVLDAVQQGTVECAHTAPYYFFGKDESFAMDCTIPFGLNSRQTTAWMFQGNGLKLLRELYAQYNIVNFPMGNTGAQMGGWYRKEIKSLADMNGLKMRIGGFGGRILAGIGAVPQNIPAGEIYQSLEKGTIDATEWIGPYDDQKLGFNKVASFYAYPAWWEGGPQLSLYVSDKAYNALSPEYKAIIECASAFAHVDMQAKYDVRNPTALKELVASGTKLFRLPKDVMDAAFKFSQQHYAELSETNQNWKKIYADYEVFRREQHQWFRFAEAGFDSYMQSQRL
jgi:TRAP-type mannitol/chloroaromatic compound transport system substrate-binding protein